MRECINFQNYTQDGKRPWENANLAFPTGQTPTVPSINIEDLIDKNFDRISMDMTKIARDMVTEQKTYTWEKDGSYCIQTIYDVYPREEQDLRFLSVYGQKMLNDLKRRKKEERFNVGFNYTGF